MLEYVAIGGLGVRVVSVGPKIRGFKPGQGQWILKGDKNPQHDFLRKGE
jgi:hypothetical protein